MNGVLELDSSWIIPTRSSPLQEKLAHVGFDQRLRCTAGTAFIGTDTADGADVVSSEDAGDLI